MFGMLAGVFVDRWDRRRTMIVSDLLRAVLTLALIPAFMSKNLPAMYALGFLISTISTVFRPAEQALIPKLVPKDLLTSANSLAQTSYMLAVLVGPALAGLTMKVVGTGNEWVAFIVDSVSFVISGIAIWLIVVPKEDPRTAEDASRIAGLGPVRQVWHELMVGLKMLVLNRTISTLAVISAIVMLGIGAVNVLWVVYLKAKFGVEGSELAWRLGLLDIAFAVGMIIASVLVGNFLSHVAPKWFIAGSLLGVGIFLIIFAYLPDYWTFMVASIGLGAFVAPINTGVSTLLQVVVPNNQLGRVSGGLGTVTEATTLISMSLAGVLGATLGIPTVFVLCGLICASMGLSSWALLPAVTLKDKPEEAVPPMEVVPLGPVSLEPAVVEEASERLVTT